MQVLGSDFALRLGGFKAGRRLIQAIAQGCKYALHIDEFMVTFQPLVTPADFWRCAYLLSFNSKLVSHLTDGLVHHRLVVADPSAQYLSFLRRSEERRHPVLVTCTPCSAKYGN